jgi:signal transduction histidine kinase
VLLLSPEKNSKRYLISKVIGFNEQNGISLVRDNFLVQWLQNNKKIVVREELNWLIEEAKDDAEKSKLMRLKANMAKIEASLCIPLFSKNTLISIIVLGSKVTHDAYTLEDLQLLQTIANQASIAIENARSYEQIQDLNKNLEDKVDQQTKEIKDKNIHLQELLKMKSEFLQIASHQLRTPLSAIRGLLSMQADGDFDKMPKEEVKTQQQRMLESSNRLSNIVNDLLDAMELEGGYLNFEFAPTDLGEMITAIMQELQPNYDRKGLYIKLVQPKEPLSKVEAEPKYLREALENFIDNAEKYTNKGGTTVTLSRKNNHAIISITDTGIGIPKTDMPKLFQKFSRGEKSTYQHTDGSGLGLFIAKNIIDEHRGTINIDSPGEGKGTTITITLPLTQPSLPKNNNRK